jgi:hypothetical protein
MARNYLNYSGQTSQPFTVMAAFIKNGSSYTFQFHTWRSTTDFNEDAEAYPPLNRDVAAKPDFVTTNGTLLTQLGTLFLNEMGLGGRGYTLDDVQWLPVSRVLTMQAIKGENRVTMIKQAADYQSFVTANLTAFQNLNTAIWNHAKANDSFFERMTPAV